MEETENSGLEETVVENTRADELEEYPKIGKNYTNSRTTNYEASNAQEKSIAKKSIGTNGFDKAVSGLGTKTKVESDKVESVSVKLPQNLAEYIDTMCNTTSEEDKNTPNGAVAIIYHEDKKTGNLEFLFEEKPVYYPVTEARGKLSFIGGAIQTGESSLEALVRELTEEIEEPAASIVIESLKRDKSLYQRLPYEYKGIRGYTDIYVIQIEQENDWNAVKWASFKHDAGFPKVLTHKDIFGREDMFAFEYGKIVKKFINDNLKPTTQKITSFLYADSICNVSSKFASFNFSRYSLVRL